MLCYPSELQRLALQGSYYQDASDRQYKVARFMPSPVSYRITYTTCLLKRVAIRSRCSWFGFELFLFLSISVSSFSCLIPLCDSSHNFERRNSYPGNSMTKETCQHRRNGRSTPRSRDARASQNQTVACDDPETGSPSPKGEVGHITSAPSPSTGSQAYGGVSKPETTTPIHRLETSLETSGVPENFLDVIRKAIREEGIQN